MNLYKLNMNKQTYNTHKCLTHVGKLFPHTVGAFCTLLEPPKCHNMSPTSQFSFFTYMFPIGSLLALLVFILILFCILLVLHCMQAHLHANTSTSHESKQTERQKVF